MQALTKLFNKKPVLNDVIVSFVKKYFVNFCIFYFIYYITFGAFSPYLNVYFGKLGFSGSQIGTLNSLGMIAGMLAAPIFGMICDKTRKTKLVMSALLIAASISLYSFMKQREYIPILVTFVLFGIFKNDIGNLQDSIASKFSSDNKLDFSKIRIYGSFGYLFGSFILAGILNRLGIEGPFFILMIICYLSCVIILFFVPSDNDNQKEDIDIIPATLKLLKNKNFLLITIIYLFGMSYVDVANNYVGLHFVNALNVSSSKIGFYTFAMVGPELLILSKGGEILNRFGWKKIYIYGAIGQTIRFLIYCFTGNIYLFYLGTITHGLSVLVSSVYNIRFMTLKINKNLLSTAISTYASITLITQALYNKVIGILIDNFGTYAVFYLGLIISLLLIVIIKKSDIFDDLKSHNN